ncbi:b(0,+)-type amino acid transporter 1 [Holothuria leucospilota]|uniref:B(0,+)-type amino acid transporter 1 n=1 Tax=Holothuria leucospilota TaxID=206669 RepID=A0A9Q1BGY8_HOLLE|nr:b(0,+)-type amino acid transporter 1 [Holothuria leucospilota]
MDRNDEISTMAPIKDEVHLRRTITLPGAVAIGFTNIIGAGIFVSPKGVIAGTGSVGVCLLVWAVCGVLSLIGAMSLAEIGTMMPVSGGLYIYINEIYGDLPGFLVQWVNIVLQQSSSQALCFLVVANYCLKPFFPGSCDVPVTLVRIIAFVANGLVAYINSRSVKLVSQTQVLFTVLNLVSFCVIITIGAMHLAQGSTENFENIFSGSHYESIGLAFYAGLYSYAGWQIRLVYFRHGRYFNIRISLWYFVDHLEDEFCSRQKGSSAAIVCQHTRPEGDSPTGIFAFDFHQQILFQVNILLPITFVIACIFLIIMSTMASPTDNAVGLGISLLGVPVYYIFVKRRCKVKKLSQIWDRFSVFTQKLLLVVPERLPSNDVK